ncbi:hypothetical protein DFH06DRAFT_1316638 [Mycena polygramma]|nr:hypothetical protein DFH06DRAFT_1316638 [Mycena polygramma]
MQSLNATYASNGALARFSGADSANFGPLAYDLWRSTVLAFVYAPGADARESAFRRGIIAAVSKGWRSALYGGPGFWSRITIDKRMPLSALDFALSKCTEGDLHLRFSLLNVRRLDGLPATPDNIVAWVDNVFKRLVPLSSRWSSFKLDTENPVIFSRVRHHCVNLEAFSLAELDLSYTHLPGYYLLVDSQASQLPFQPRSWFKSVLPCLVRLSVYCVPLHMENDLMFEGLQVVDLACYDCPASIPVDVLPRLFAVATRLRSLRLGTLSPFSLPDHYVLHSSSLKTLDLSFDSGPVAGAIFDALECPSLTELVVREVRDCVHYLFACPVILNRILVFRVHGDIGDHISLQHLFAALPRLQSLDLLHSSPDVFHTYCDWVRLRIKFNQSVWLQSLRSLDLPAVDLSALVRLVNLVGESIFPEVGRIGVERLRVERPADMDAEWNSVQWLRRIVPDFAFTDVYQYIGGASPGVSALSLSSFSPSFATVSTLSFPVYFPSSLAMSARLSQHQELDPDGNYSSLLDLRTFVTEKPPYPAIADPSRTYLWEDIAHVLFPGIAEDSSLTFEALIELRGRLMLTSRWARYKICDIPAFWTRLIISPRPQLDTVRAWLEMTDKEPFLPLTLSFRATRGASVSPYFPNNNLGYWVDTAAELLASQLDRCVSLSITADSVGLLNEILFFIEDTRPVLLKSMDVVFGIPNYSHLRPPALQDFSFIELPPLGLPFRPPTSISWMSAEASNPGVTLYAESETASCSIVNPSAQHIDWFDVISVLTSSPVIDTLILDGLMFDHRPGTLTCSPPLHSLVSLDVTFRGSDSMAQLVTRLNAPSLRVLTVNVTSTHDVQCLCSCPALLATVEELVLIGTCAPGNEFYAIYSLLHRAIRINLNLASNLFYSALVVASRRPRPRAGPNWNACPSLKHLRLHHVSLRSIQELLLMRLSKGYDMVESVYVRDPEGGEDATISAWFHAHDVTLSIVS